MKILKLYIDGVFEALSTNFDKPWTIENWIKLDDGDMHHYVMTLEEQDEN